MAYPPTNDQIIKPKTKNLKKKQIVKQKMDEKHIDINKRSGVEAMMVFHHRENIWGCKGISIDIKKRSGVEAMKVLGCKA